MESDRTWKRHVFIFVAIMTGLLPLLTYLLCYVMALQLHHLPNSPKLASISDMGNNQPEHMILALSACMTSLIHTTIIYARYLELQQFQNPSCPQSNITSCCVGLFSVLGELIQSTVKRSDSAWVHFLGKALHSTSICMYVGIQAYISMQQKQHHTNGIACLRFVVATFSITCPSIYVIGISCKSLKSSGVAQGAELGLLLLNTMFWISLAITFKENPFERLLVYHTNISTDQYQYSGEIADMTNEANDTIPNDTMEETEQLDNGCDIS